MVEIRGLDVILEKFFCSVYFQRFIAIVCCGCFCIVLLDNSVQNVCYEFSYSDIEKKFIIHDGSFGYDIEEIEDNFIPIQNQNVKIALYPIYKSGYLNGIDFYIYYETKEYVNAIYEINHNLEVDIFNMEILEAYEFTDYGKTLISPQQTRIGCKKNSLAECGWRVESSMFSPQKKYVYIVRVFTINPNTVSKSELSIILRNIQFEMKGYL